MTDYGIFHGVKTAYRDSGEGKAMVLLHGWGQNMDMMKAIEDHFNAYFHVYNLDFPGHGQSENPPVAWSVDDYTDFLEDFLKQNDITDPILIAHSFGCRVAIHYAYRHPELKKMCLTGAAGIKPVQSTSQKLKVKAYKAGKAFLKATHQTKKLEEYQNRSGSEDYRNAKGVMRETFVKVVNDDVSWMLKDIKASVLLVWGENDTAVPLWMGKKMEEEMADAGLAIFEGDDHFAYWHQPDRFNRVLEIFLQKEMSE